VHPEYTSEVKSLPVQRVHYGWVVVGAALCVAIVAYAVHYSYGVFFNPLAVEFGWTRAMTSGAFSLYMLSRGGFGIVTGWATDKYGPRITVVAGGLFIALGLLLTSYISALWQLYIFYSLLVGLGVSVAFAPLVATVARWFDTRRGLATGIVLAGVGLGTAIMPASATYFIENYGWSSSYIILGIIALVTIVPAALLLRRSPEEMGLVPYGSNAAAKTHGFGVTARGLSLRQALGTLPFWLLFVITILFASCLYLVMVHITPHARDLGISPVVAGSFLAVIGIATILGRLAGGWLADAVGRRRSLAICLFLQAVAVFSLMVIKDVGALYGFAVVFGLAYGSVVCQLPLIAGDLFGLHSVGAIVGLEMLGTSLGGAIGPALGGYIFDATQSYYYAFLVTTAGLFMALVLIPLLRAPGTSDGKRQVSSSQ
jgi:MFS family permease